MPMTRKKRIQKAPPADKNISFSYTQVGMLEKFINEQGSILPRVRTGLSQQQQRRLSRSVKYARHLALLPFTQTL